MPDSKSKTPTDLLRGEHGKFIGKADPPLIDLKITNPVNYLKICWAKVMGNEGIDISFKVRPLTAITIALIVGSLGFGVGRLTVPEPFSKYVPFLATPEPLPTPNPWRNTAYTGVVRYSDTTKKYYLEVGPAAAGGETINLEAPANVALTKLVGKRILAVGQVNDAIKLLKVIDVSDLEVLPSLAIPIPTLPPSTIEPSL